MELLIIGLFLWSATHFIPSLGNSYKTLFINRFGEKVYTALFSVVILSSLALIVFGWRSATPTFLYVLPDIVRPIAMILLVLAFLLFGAAKHQTRIKRVVRHPQLTSVIVWSSAHLLVNGDSRSVTLFACLGAWAILEIIFINKREGPWVKPDAPSWKIEIKGILISIAIFFVAFLLHPYIAGVSLR